MQALVTLAGNPARSTPNSGRLEAALETARLLRRVRPVPERSDAPRRRDPAAAVAAAALALRHRLLPAVRAQRGELLASRPAARRRRAGEWRTLLRLAGVVAGQGPNVDVDAFDRMVALEIVRRATPDPEAFLAELEPRTGPDRMLDAMLRVSPYDLTLADLEARPTAPTSAARAASPGVLRTPSGNVELAPPKSSPTSSACARRSAAAPTAGSCSLAAVNSAPTTRGCTTSTCSCAARSAARCTSTPPTPRLGLADGEPARVSGRAGAVAVPVEATDAVMPGVVSMPHGWGHDGAGGALRVAAAHAGTNSSVLTDETVLDALSGNAVLNGIPVEVAP